MAFFVLPLSTLEVCSNGILCNNQSQLVSPSGDASSSTACSLCHKDDLSWANQTTLIETGHSLESFKLLLLRLLYTLIKYFVMRLKVWGYGTGYS